MSNPIIREQKSIGRDLLKAIRVNPPRYTHEYVRRDHSRGSAFLNLCLRGNRNRDPKGIHVTNLGPTIEDPRMGNRHAPQNKYARKRAGQRRGQLPDFDSSTGSVSDYQSIGSAPWQKLMSPEGRQMIFRRKGEMYDTVADYAKPINAKQAKLMFQDNTAELDQIYKLDRIRDVKKGLIWKDEHPAYDITDRDIIDAATQRMKRRIEDEKIILHPFKDGPQYKEIINDMNKKLKVFKCQKLIGNIDRMAEREIKLTGRMRQTTKIVQNILMIDTAIKEYYNNKVPVRNLPLSTFQKQNIDFIKESIPEREVMNVIKNVQDKVLQNIRDFSDDSVRDLPNIVNNIIKKTAHMGLKPFFDVMYTSEPEKPVMTSLRGETFTSGINREYDPQIEHQIYAAANPKAIPSVDEIMRKKGIQYERKPQKNIYNPRYSRAKTNNGRIGFSGVRRDNKRTSLKTKRRLY